MTTGRTAVVTLGAQIARRPQRAALVGSPNVGKTSLFNVLTGMRQKVGNYPGVTVERRSGTMTTPSGSLEVIDLPGTYSLLPRSPDERIARDELLGRVEGDPPPDVVVLVADASHLERSLFLLSQLFELGKPVIVALNQVDLALQAGLEVDAAALSNELGVPVIPTSGRTGEGREDLAAALARGGVKGDPAPLELPPGVDAAAAEISGRLSSLFGGVENARRAVRTRFTSEAAAAALRERIAAESGADAAACLAAFDAARARLAADGVDVATATAAARYAWAEGISARTVRRVAEASPVQHAIDRVLVHPWIGALILIAVFTTVFYVVYDLSSYPIDLVDSSMGALGQWAGGLFGDGLLANFVEKGLVAGFGAFLVFVPQILLLFLLIEALDDTGYLSRAAFLLDRIMGTAGLPGRAFLPLLSGFACAIPAIMATRTIENKTDRFVTILVAPLMSCQARLPVYAVIVGALFVGYGSWARAGVVASMYLIGIVVAFFGAKLLRRGMGGGPRSTLLLELPPYRLPSARTVLRNSLRRTWAFVAGAGPIILALTIALWFGLTFPRNVTYSQDYDASIARAQERLRADSADPAAQGELASLRNARESERLAHTYMGSAAQFIEPVFEPLGFDWKIDVAILGSFAAREVFVPTLGVIYSVGEVEDEEQAEQSGLLERMRTDKRPDGSRVFTPLVGISLLVFYVIALQCISTLAVIKRETNSWKWPLACFLTLTALAYLASLAVFQIGTLIGF